MTSEHDRQRGSRTDGAAGTTARPSVTAQTARGARADALETFPAYLSRLLELCREHNVPVVTLPEVSR